MTRNQRWPWRLVIEKNAPETTQSIDTEFSWDNLFNFEMIESFRWEWKEAALLANMVSMFPGK